MNDVILYAIGVGLFVLIVFGLVWLLRSRPPRLAEPDPTYAWGEPADFPPPSPAPREPSTPSQPAPRMPPPAPAMTTVTPAPATTSPESGPPSAMSAAAPPPTGPVHVCKCPHCQTQFSVTGAKPIVTNCPGCGKKGYLR